MPLLASLVVLIAHAHRRTHTPSRNAKSRFAGTAGTIISGAAAATGAAAEIAGLHQPAARPDGLPDGSVTIGRITSRLNGNLAENIIPLCQ